MADLAAVRARLEALSESMDWSHDPEMATVIRTHLAAYDAQAARLAAVLFAVQEATVTASGRCAGCLGNLHDHVRDNRACCYWELHRVREALTSVDAGAAGEGRNE